MRYFKVFVAILASFLVIGTYTCVNLYGTEMIQVKSASFLKLSLRKYGVIRNPPIQKNCYKENEADTYQVCEKLPYFFTTCGNNSKESKEGYLIPNIVHFVWVGDRDMHFYDYLTVRSAAFIQKPDVIMFYYSETKPKGDLWERVEREVPCLKMVKFVAPTTLYGKRVNGNVHQTDVARMAILLEHGGIYADSDAMILRPLEPIRKYEFVMGRSAPKLLSSGVILSQPNATFLRTWRSYYNIFQTGDFFVTFSLRVHRHRRDLPIHIEDDTMQRPNPWYDGIDCMFNKSFDLSKNYFLHIHPFKSLSEEFREFRDDDLRLHDSTYGAGARIVLFGTSDLIYLKNDTQPRRNKTTPKTLTRYPDVTSYDLPEALPEGELGVDANV